MLQLIIDAYEEKNKDESFFINLKKMDKVNRICIIIIILTLVIPFLLFIFRKYEWCLFTVIVWVVLVYISIYIISGRVRKKWKDNINNYNNKLDSLKDILCEENINYYSKSKIEKLINQCEKSINELVYEKEKKREKRNGFIEKYIFPIIAFGAGVMSGSINTMEVLQMCIVAIIIVIITNVYIWEANMFIETMTGNELEKRKYLRGNLEDLLIRDFEVSDSNI